MAKEENKGPTPEEQRKQRDYSLERTKSEYLISLAAPQLVSKEVYGDLANFAQYIPRYHTEDESLYNELEGYMREKGLVNTNETLQKRALEVLISHLSNLTVEDIAEMVGFKGKLNPEYSGKYIIELGEDAQKIVAVALGDISDKMVETSLAIKRGQRVNSLEKILGKPAETENPK